MDLEMEMSLHELAELLKELGFNNVTVRDDDTLEAKKRAGWGRIHILAKEIETGKVYVDVHWDAFLHFLMLGVDYAKRPKEICEKILNKATEKGKKGKIIGGTSWFNRKNKAIITGIKIKK